MDRVLIFTNVISWGFMSSKFRPSEWRDDYPQQGGNQLVECLFQSGHPVSLRAVTDCRTEGVYLVCDSIAPKRMAEIKRQCAEEGNIYVLYHSNTKAKIRDITQLENCTCREGRHTGDRTKTWWYPDILEILLDNADNKLGRIVDKLKLSKAERRERAINSFITYSVKPAANPVLLKKAYDELCTYDVWRDQVKDFYEFINPENGPVEYRSYAKMLNELSIFLHAKSKEMNDNA